MADVLFLGPLLSIIMLALVVIVALKFGKDIIWLIINSVIGILFLIVINFLPIVNITINIWSVLIAVFGGIPGIILLILLDLLKVAF
ncbi:MAG: pro-sigmaK processing inhibitor BofA family protein [archaeon]